VVPDCIYTYYRYLCIRFSHFRRSSIILRSSYDG